MPTLPGDSVLKRAGPWSGVVDVRRTAIQPEEGASLSDSLFAAGEEAWLASPLSSISRMGELRDAEESGVHLSADDARARIEQEGLTGRITVSDQGINRGHLDILLDRKREEMKRAEIIASAPQGFGAGAARFSAAFVASMFDPINVASAFVPVVGQARYLRMLQKAGGIGGRTAVRAGVGAIEGGVGAALVEPIVALAKSEEQADYDLTDSLANIAFGTVFGGGLHVVGGAGADLYRALRGVASPWDLPGLKAGREANAAIYDDVYGQLRSVGRAEDEAAANASLVASTFRSLADVTGRGADELYAQYGPRIALGAEVAAGRVFDQPAFHGTPHTIGPEGFRLDKIGTGEGAQAYGWGLYFAENPAVARDYQRRLSDTSAHQKFFIDGRQIDPNSPEKHAASLLYYNDPREIRATTKRWLKEYQTSRGMQETAEKAGLTPEAYWTRLNDFVQSRKRKEITVEKGRLYQVDIADEAVAKMLDWDAPLSEQPESVREALVALAGLAQTTTKYDRMDDLAIAALLDEHPRDKNYQPTGAEIYSDLTGLYGSQEGATRALQKVGIPGIRYLDQSSRNSAPVAVVKNAADEVIGQIPYTPDAMDGPIQKLAESRGESPDGYTIELRADGTRNIVVFDEKIVKITHKDGTPVTAQERKELLQTGPSGKRGQIGFGGDRVNISLFKNADRSTFLHETGHLYLEMFSDLASRADAPEALRTDMAVLREWLGAKDGPITREQHEQFARGLEAFVMEGRAPASNLTKVFERFRDWLVGIYRDIRALGAELSDDVRGVYDRLISGYPAAERTQLAGPAKREAALKTAVAQMVTGKNVNGAEPIINGDAKAARHAADNQADALDEPTPEPLGQIADDTDLEAAKESLADVTAAIKASGDVRAVEQLGELDEITEQATAWAKTARALAPCIGRTDG